MCLWFLSPPIVLLAFSSNRACGLTIGVLAHMQRIVHCCANGALVNKVPSAKLLDFKLKHTRKQKEHSIKSGSYQG